jgi:F0F1-type ATP synthase assembly protein I
MVVASRWVSQITNIALQMVLPAGLGYWLDRRWGTDPWMVSLGAALGFFVAMTSLVQLAKQANVPRQTKPVEAAKEPKSETSSSGNKSS